MNYKKKTGYLLAGFFLSLVLVWMFSIKNTVALYVQNKEITANIEQSGKSEDKETLRHELNSLQKTIETYSVDSVDGGDMILKTTGELCRKNNVVLKDVPQSEDSEANTFKIRTNKVIMEGNFINLLKVLNDFENNKAGHIASASFESYFDNRRKNTILTLTIYIQNVKTTL